MHLSCLLLHTVLNWVAQLSVEKGQHVPIGCRVLLKRHVQAF